MKRFNIKNKLSNMSSTNTIRKKCQICEKEYTCSYRTRNTSKFCSDKCRQRNFVQSKNKELNSFVICPLCKGKYKEINNFHVTFHGLTMDEWKEKYKDFDNLSVSSRENKSNLNKMSSNELKQWKQKLKKSHTLEGYIEKYGDKLGKEKYEIRCNNINNARTKEYYINKYGIDNYNIIKKNRGITLEKYILKYGEKLGKEKYENWIEWQKEKGTLMYYLKKHGENKGYEKWFNKNKKISKSNRSIDVDRISEYEKYCIEVDKETRLSLQLNKLDNIELRNDDYHLDHMISKCYGFNNNVPSKIIGSIHNLKIIPSNENLSKQKKCSMTLEELYMKYK